MAAHKQEALLFSDLKSVLADISLGAACIYYHAVFVEMLSVILHPPDRCFRVEREDYQIALLQLLIRELAVNDALHLSHLRDALRIQRLPVHSLCMPLRMRLR